MRIKRCIINSRAGFYARNVNRREGSAIPASISHLLFAEQVLSKLSSREMKKMIEKNKSYYSLGALGPDIFFFKGYTNYKVRLYKRIAGGRPIVLTEMALRLHKEHIRGFIEWFYQYAAEKKNGPNKKDYERILSYYAGYLTHYVLDKEIHSYVSATEPELLQRVRSARMDFVHMKIESNLDAAFLSGLKDKSASEYRINDVLNLEKDRCKVVAKAYRQAFFTLWGVSIPVEHIAETFLDVKKGFETLYKKLIKRRGESRVARRVPGIRSLYFVVTPKQMEEDFDYINLEGRTWKNPNSPEDSESSENVFGIFGRARGEAAEFIDAVARGQTGGAPPDFERFVDRAYNGIRL